MAEKKDKFSKEYEKLRDEMIRDKIKEAVAGNPADYREALEEIGFTWFDDDYPSEEEEESAAVPENDRQRLLVSCFEGRTEVSAAILEALLAERKAEAPNYPLIRKYFRDANAHLKNLILFGLESKPADFDLLTDLVFFNEFDRNLPELIGHFVNACRITNDPQKFSEIAREFYYSTKGDGYDALAALRAIFDKGSAKRKIIDFLIKEHQRQEQEIISF